MVISFGLIPNNNPRGGKRYRTLNQGRGQTGMNKILLALLLLLPAVPTQAQQILRSPSQQATLVELYTSEGCSSCPPADRWYSTLLNHPGLWRDVVPVAFHVDYWNYLGWEDRFANKAWSRRQQQHRTQGNSRAVYTPAVMAAGKEWRDWRYHNRALPELDTNAGVLTVELVAGKFSANFEPASPTPQKASVLNLALLGVGMQTRVRAGENRGKVLSHDFVVLDHRSYSAENLLWQGELPASTQAADASALAWVAWVSTPDNLAALQATGGWVSTK
jgi:hypothetical protein